MSSSIESSEIGRIIHECDHIRIIPLPLATSFEVNSHFCDLPRDYSVISVKNSYLETKNGVPNAVKATYGIESDLCLVFLVQKPLLVNIT